MRLGEQRLSRPLGLGPALQLARDQQGPRPVEPQGRGVVPVEGLPDRGQGGGQLAARGVHQRAPGQRDRPGRAPPGGGDQGVEVIEEGLGVGQPAVATRAAR